ncbi:hypothetical protein GGTG_13316 [Gaeumannomyces tritici R3-111a-1]|uniref:Uncharacterized protein n=1 Tax=Gaeumannomyces tritici (strain R3-111a-1) TaxID=644352 RepID=J3PII8_GAET3|nr:hypothetical protein GGTG_13316 [Gaeumannomyces tritici R3-111a-1]EJT69207.1 hypothetical protein GGTG_13316 [Gaeumannomyces tritici R3-111a-1]
MSQEDDDRGGVVSLCSLILARRRKQPPSNWRHGPPLEQAAGQGHNPPEHGSHLPVCGAKAPFARNYRWPYYESSKRAYSVEPWQQGLAAIRMGGCGGARD